MNRAAINAAVTMGQLQQKLNTIANNLANANTNGFKRRETTFANLLVQQINNQPVAGREVGRQTPDGIRSGSGAAIAATTLRSELGAIKQTDRMLDVALTREGLFFQVDHHGQVEYTRDGAFYLTPSENPNLLNIVASDGSFLLGQDGPIEIPADYRDIVISDDGEITVRLQNDAVVNVGQIQLVQVNRPQLLRAVGNNRFTAPDPQTGIALADVLEAVEGLPVFSQGSLESANVDISREMTNLLETQRHYQFNARSLSIADDMMGLVNQLR